MGREEKAEAVAEAKEASEGSTLKEAKKAGPKLPPVKWFRFEVAQKDFLPLVNILARMLVTVGVIIPAFFLVFQGPGLREVGVSFISSILGYWFGVAKSAK